VPPRTPCRRRSAGSGRLPRPARRRALAQAGRCPGRGCSTAATRRQWSQGARAAPRNAAAHLADVFGERHLAADDSLLEAARRGGHARVRHGRTSRRRHAANADAPRVLPWPPAKHGERAPRDVALHAVCFLRNSEQRLRPLGLATREGFNRAAPHAARSRRAPAHSRTGAQQGPAATRLLHAHVRVRPQAVLAHHWKLRALPAILFGIAQQTVSHGEPSRAAAARKPLRTGPGGGQLFTSLHFATCTPSALCRPP
jgi:hypothetical protein